MIDGIAALIGTVAGLVYSDGAEANVFVDYMPASPDRAVAVYTQLGPEADSRLPYDPVEFQVIVRSEQDGAWAREMSAAVYSFLHGKRNLTLPDGTYAVFILATNASPFPLGADESGRQRLTTDYRSEVLNYTSERS